MGSSTGKILAGILFAAVGSVFWWVGVGEREPLATFLGAVLWFLGSIALAIGVIAKGVSLGLEEASPPPRRRVEDDG